MTACKDCANFSGNGTFVDNAVPKIETREEAEWFAPLKCRAVSTLYQIWDPVNGTMEEWKGYANVRDINNDPGKNCPHFELRASLGAATNSDVKPEASGKLKSD